MPPFKRNFGALPPVERFLALRLRGALLEVSGALPNGRPHPVDTWDKLGGKDADLRSLWLDKPIELCRSALAAAKSQGAPVFEETTRRVEHFYTVMCAASMDGFECKPSADLSREILELQLQIAEASKAAAIAQVDPSEKNLEQLQREVLDVEAESKDVVPLLSRRIAARPARLMTST